MVASPRHPLQNPLDFEPAFEIVDVPRADGEEDDSLDEGPVFDARVLGVSMRR